MTPLADFFKGMAPAGEPGGIEPGGLGQRGVVDRELDLGLGDPPGGLPGVDHLEAAGRAVRRAGELGLLGRPAGRPGGGGHLDQDSPRGRQRPVVHRHRDDRGVGVPRTDRDVLERHRAGLGQEPAGPLRLGGVERAEADPVVQRDLAGLAPDQLPPAIDLLRQVGHDRPRGVAPELDLDRAGEERQGVDRGRASALAGRGGAGLVAVGVVGGVLDDQGGLAVPERLQGALLVDHRPPLPDVALAEHQGGGGEAAQDRRVGERPLQEWLLVADLLEGEERVEVVVDPPRGEPVERVDPGQGEVDRREERPLRLEAERVDPAALGDDHRVAGDLAEADRQLAGPGERRVLRELVAGVDPPAVVGPDVLPAVVVAVHGDHVARLVSPALRVVEQGLVGGPPVGGVDERPAAQLIPIELDDPFVELALGVGEEFELVGRPTGHASGLGDGQVVHVEQADPAGTGVVARGLRVRPRFEGGRQRPVLRGQPAGEFRGQAGLLGRLDRLGGPEEQAVLVLDLDDRDRGVSWPGGARCAGWSGRRGPRPRPDTALLERLVEEQEAPEVGARIVARDAPLREVLAGRPVGGDGGVDPLLLEPRRRTARSPRSPSGRSR